MPKKNDLTKAKNSINAKGELLIYGEIGDWWDGLDAMSVVQQIEAASGDEIVIRLHTPGGNVMEAIAMYNRLKQSPKRVVAYIDGIAASMGAYLAMAADVIHMPANALYMWHKPWLDVSGNALQLRELADNLDLLEQSAAMMVADKTGMSQDDVHAMLAGGEDIWMNGIEAVEKGFADFLVDPIEAVASIDLNGHNPPATKFNQLFLTQSAAPPASTEMRKVTMSKRKANKASGGATMTALAVLAISAQFNNLVSPDNTRDDMLATLATKTGLDDQILEAILSGKATEVSEAQATTLASELQMSYGDVIAVAAQAPEAGNLSVSNTVVVDAAAVAQKAIVADRKRGQDIRALGAKAGLKGEDINNMVDTGMSLEEARGQTLDLMTARDAAGQPVQPFIRAVAGDNGALRTAMAAAMLNRISPATYKLEESNAEFRGMSMLEMSRAMLEYGGHQTRGLNRNELVAKALHSTSDFPLIVADVSNKVLRKAYDETPRTFMQIATQATATDFKDKHSLQIGGGEGLEKVGDSGEYKRGTVSESDETYKLETFGRIFGFTRQLIINDDLGALAQFMQRVGGLASRKESDIVWGLVTSNPNLSDGTAVFASATGRKNLGTGAAVTETSLSQARKLMRQQKGLDDEYINIAGNFLVVNSERETEAQKQLSAVLAATSGDVNIFQNSLQLIVEERITASNNPWYVFANPAQADTIEYAYLDGQTGPSIETRNGFDVDGVEIKISHDFGAGWVDYRGAVKNPGV